MRDNETIHRARAVRAVIEAAGFVDVDLNAPSPGALVAVVGLVDGTLWHLAIPAEVSVDQVRQVVTGWVCECCRLRPAAGRVRLPGDEVRLCGTCLDDARTLGLLSGGAA